MKLSDLRNLAVRRQARIHFPLSDGRECVISEHGIAQVPGLADAPGFNLEQELEAVAVFRLESAVSVVRSPQPVVLTRNQIADMTAAGSQRPQPAEPEA